MSVCMQRRKQKMLRIHRREGEASEEEGTIVCYVFRKTRLIYSSHILVHMHKMTELINLMHRPVAAGNTVKIYSNQLKPLP